MKILSALTTLAGALAGITAVLYATGFLSVQASLNLLGVSRLVDVATTDYLTEGGRFVILLPIYLLLGLVLLAPLVFAGRLVGRRISQNPSALIPVLMVLAIGTFGLVAWMLPENGYLISDPSVSRKVAPGSLAGGNNDRRLQLVAFAVTAAAIALQLWMAWWTWEERRGRWKLLSHILGNAHYLLLAMTVILATFVPPLFGLLAHPLRLPYVILQPSKDAKLQTAEGYLLNRWTGPESAVVLYRPASKDVVVVPKGSIDSVVVSRLGFIGSAK